MGHDLHGTSLRYGQGCRCAICKEAWATYCRTRRRSRGQRPRRVTAALKRLPRGAVLSDEAYYQGRNGPLVVRPTALGRQLFQAAQLRTGRDQDDVLEHLLRNFAPFVSFDEPAAHARSTE